MLAAVFAVLFGLSLLPGRECLCLKFARRISDGILPEGAVRYCRRLTWVWFAVLAALAALGVWAWTCPPPWRYLWGGASLVVVPLVFFIEGRWRRRRFAVVFHTSGSTGHAKTVVKDFAMLAREVAFHRRALADVFASPVTVIGTVDPQHMYGRLWLDLLPKAAGCAEAVRTVAGPEELEAAMKGAARVLLVTTPSFLDRVTAYAGQYDFPRTCVEIVTSGALLTADVSRRTREVFGIAPREIFGSTETGGVACRRQDHAVADGFDWQVFPDVRVAVRDGRLEVRSPFSFRRTYLMGDGAQLSPDARRFRLLGRRDRLVKIREERVDLEEMEGRVRELGFREAALVKLPGEHGDVLALALVLGAGEARPTTLELRARLLKVFPKGTVPRKFRFVEALPRNSQGKVLSHDVAALF